MQHEKKVRSLVSLRKSCMDSTEISEIDSGPVLPQQSGDEGNEHADDSAEWQLLEPLCDSSLPVKRKFGRLDSSASAECGHYESDRSSSHLSEGGSRDLIHRWQQISTRCVRNLVDPWVIYNFEKLPVRNCKRHHYSSIDEKWTVDDVQVKLHPEPFARGAMRECYRLKKLSSFSKTGDWSHAQNFVAKRYMCNVEKEVLFEDVKLQMDSKLWAEEFNRHNPPKKIDIFQICVLEFLDEEEHRFYHLERFIEGEYIKYNSNSGFVSEVCRNTPQAFSHFTFERSGHQMIVVDIQGVGDLYTDPQIHTATGEGYGSGNLGTKGMALFFHSHLCNDICRSMCLTEFDLAVSERKALTTGNNPERAWGSSTISSSKRQTSVCSSLVEENGDAMEQLRRRTVSVNSLGRRSSTSSYCDEYSNVDVRSGFDDYSDQGFRESDKPGALKARHISLTSSNFDSLSDEAKERILRASPFGSMSSCSSRITREAEREAYWLEKRKLSRPAGLLSEAEMAELCDYAEKVHHNTNSTLGQMHLDLARYHELGRFVQNAVSACSEKENFCTEEGYNDKKDLGRWIEYDEEAAFFHLDIARRCGILEAIITMAKMAFGLPHELLKELDCEKVWKNDDLEGTGFELMECAAGMGDQSAVIFVAQAYETGRFLGPLMKPSWPKAVAWYEKALSFLESSETKENETPDEGVPPRYELLERIALMYKEGGYDLPQDLTKAYDLYTEAAVSATEAMRGKLANKYYELAEQCD